MLLECLLKGQSLEVGAPEQIDGGDDGGDDAGAAVDQVEQEAGVNQDGHHGPPLLCSAHLQGQRARAVNCHQRAVPCNVDQNGLLADHGKREDDPEESGDSQHPGDNLRGAAQDADELAGECGQLVLAGIQFRGEHETCVEPRSVDSGE